MAQYSVNNYSVDNIISWINSGEIAIPEMQRPFVWDSTKVRDLIDSLYKGYPIGYIIIWKNPDVKLKDGTILTHITDSGTGSLLKNGTYQILFSTDRILDVDQVESLLFQKTSKCEGSTYTIEDLYEVPFR